MLWYEAVFKQLKKKKKAYNQITQYFWYFLIFFSAQMSHKGDEVNASDEDWTKVGIQW